MRPPSAEPGGAFGIWRCRPRTLRLLGCHPQSVPCGLGYLGGGAARARRGSLLPLPSEHCCNPGVQQ
eukprot:7340477-Pyramimonas_sp.AAC.1